MNLHLVLLADLVAHKKGGDVLALVALQLDDLQQKCKQSTPETAQHRLSSAKV